MFVILTWSMYLSSNYNQSSCKNNSPYYMMILLKLLFDRRWKSPKEDDLILQRPGIAKMIHQMILVISLLLMVFVLFNNISSQQCGIDTYSVYQMMLKATPLRRSGLDHFHLTAERHAPLTTGVKTITTSCSKTYANWITGPRRLDQRT